MDIEAFLIDSGALYVALSSETFERSGLQLVALRG